MSAWSAFDKQDTAMNAGRSRRDYAVKPQISWGRLKFVTPRWFLQWQLRWVEQGIDTLERQLEDEFGLSETGPLHHELALLIAERDALLARLQVQT